MKKRNKASNIVLILVVLLVGALIWKDLLNTYKKAEKGVAAVETDSMMTAESELIKQLDAQTGYTEGEKSNLELIKFIEENPSTIDYPFTKLQEENYVRIKTSEDGNLRIYYWDTGKGGSMTIWDNICQYRSEGKVHAVHGSIDNAVLGKEDGDGEFTKRSILYIETLYGETDTIYLISECFQTGGAYAYYSLSTVGIEEGKIVNRDIFRKGGEAVDNIGQEYCFGNWYDRTNGEGYDCMYKYDKENKRLYVPIGDGEYGNIITDRYDVYEFDGKEFNYAGEDGGCWLHKSIREFEKLVQFGDVEEKRIRIDSISGGKYRYTVWETSTDMSRKPDKIIEGGKYDEELGSYIFEENNIRYIVKTGYKIEQTVEKI